MLARRAWQASIDFTIIYAYRLPATLVSLLLLKYCRSKSISDTTRNVTGLLIIDLLSHWMLTCAVQILEVALSLLMCCSLVCRANRRARLPFVSLQNICSSHPKQWIFQNSNCKLIRKSFLWIAGSKQLIPRFDHMPPHATLMLHHNTKTRRMHGTSIIGVKGWETKQCVTWWLRWFFRASSLPDYSFHLDWRPTWIPRVDHRIRGAHRIYKHFTYSNHIQTARIMIRKGFHRCERND